MDNEARTISNPICVVCGNTFHTDSYVWENDKGFCCCSVECILKAKGFKRIKWGDKYKAFNITR